MAFASHRETARDSPVILQRFPLGFQWPTVDPFLFCVHHVDAYPAGDANFGPVTGLAGRNIGQDFEGVDGWRMYHGQTVPGFPQHPHRGFETVTYVRQGLIDHSDSLGAAARYGEGDVQWLTAGSGIVHSEMFPLLKRDQPNPTELFQIWVNLPRRDKMAPPFFTMLWNEDIPRHRAPGVEVTVVAGRLAGLTPPPPPPNSWASQSDSDVAIWHIRLAPGSNWTMPSAKNAGTVRLAYTFGGTDASFASDRVDVETGAVIRCDADIEVSSAGGAEILILQGRPINEPVAQHGPFVMNDRAGVEQAFSDYRQTGFGGWPWPTDDPVHGAEPTRFARQPGGVGIR
jgi:quercetin 2,3-dioxygenase